MARAKWVTQQPVKLQSLGFQEIDKSDKNSKASKFLPSNATLAECDGTGIIIVVEKMKVYNSDVIHFGLLDKIAIGIYALSEIKDKKKSTITKTDAQNVANILTEQSKKLFSMAETYRLMAAALSASKDDFIEITSEDPNIKKAVTNPFK